MATFSQDIQYFSISTPLGKDAVVLNAIEGEEGVSSLFLYKLKLYAPNKDIAFDSVIGKTATITVKFNLEAAERYIDGIITAFELSHFDEREGVAYYEADLRPWPFMLTLSGDCRIFQAKSVPDIVTEVCSGAGYSFVKNSLTATYSPKEYCVQYEETDYNFVARLLEQEGIFYYFEHANGSHQMVLGDDKSAFTACPTVSTLNYRPQLADDDKDDVLTDIHYEQSVATMTYGVDAFNFETPSTDLYATSAGAKGKGTRSRYLGFPLNSTETENYAKILLQGAAAPATLLSGSGRARSLVSGHTFTLAGHPRSDVNAEYVIRRLRIEANRKTYRASFDAFPSSVPFRPFGTATKPRIHSTQTAIVTGKAGEEIWVDKYGRIKVQFPWDRLGKNDDQTTCWIRVAHNWAGKTYGIVFLPRIGQEVLVSFLEGDPDRPLVTGSVYNAEQTIPYELPANSTKSTIKSQSSKNGTGKYNEIRFEDKLDAEEIYVHAQKDMNVDVINNLTTNVTGDESHNVKKGKDANGAEKGGHRTVFVEMSETHTNKDTFTWTVDKTSSTTVTGAETHANKDSHTWTVDKTRSTTVTGAETHTNKDAFTQSVTKDYTLTVDGNLSITVTGDVTFKGKSLTFEATSAAVSMKSATEMTVKSGTAMTVQSGTSMDIKSQMAMTLDSTMGLDLKAQLALNAQGLTATVKGTASGEVSASGILTLKGSLTKIG